MSFSSDIKDKVSMIKNECEFCNRAELAAMIRYAGRIRENGLILTTENENAVKCMKELLAAITGIEADYEYTEKSRLYELFVTDKDILEIVGEIIMLSDDENNSLIPYDCCRNAYVRGAFLGGGSISDPKKSYHMEFDARFLSEAERLCKILEKAGLGAKITNRKGHEIVYIKDYETIADVVAMIGDSTAAFNIYNISAEKDIRNTINRQMNCESANMDKVANAYQKHLAAIAKIKRTIGLEKLPEVLQEIADVRVKYPEDSLKMLGERLDNPIGKSGVNHRLNRIVEIAQDIDE